MTDKLKNIIGKNIRKYRESHNETSLELSEVIGVSRSTISEWENGNKMPRAGSIEKLSQHWKIPKSKILNEQTPIDTNVQTIAAHLNDNVTADQLKKITDYIDYITKDNEKD